MYSKTESNSNITEMPRAEAPKRKILGFYFDSLGEIETVEEGLTETERLALLNFGRIFCSHESELAYSKIRGKVASALTG
jgi:hypothetical protein